MSDKWVKKLVSLCMGEGMSKSVSECGCKSVCVCVQLGE